MNFNINVINQRMFLEEDSTLNGFANDSKEFVEGSQEFVKFHFTFSEEWDSLVTFAQFIQSGKGYNVYLDDNNNVYLPPEIKSGKCNLVLYGSRDKIIATTNYISLILNKYLLIKDASSTEITEPLYNQLVNKVAEIAEKLNDKADKVDIPTKLSQLEDDPQHRVVTDAQIKRWNAGGGGDSMWQVVDLDFSGETATTTQSAQEIYSAMELGIYTVFVIRGVEGVQSAIADIYLPTKIYATTISGNSKIDFLVEDLSVRYITDPLNRVDLDIIGGKVGQTIVIKTADENGVPTSWEVKDYPDLSNFATKDEVGVVDKKIDDYKVSNDKVVGEKADKTELSKYALQSAVDLKADKEYVDTALLGKADSEAVTELSSKVDEALGATVTNADAISNLKTTKADKTEIPKNTSDLINDSNYVTAEELANAKEWQTAEITLTSESEGTSSLSSQEIYSAYLKGVYTAVSNKSEIGGDLYLVNTYTENVCVATMAREKSVSFVAIIGNNVTLSSSNFATKKDIPTKTSQLANDSDFATKTDVSNASTLVVTITANPLDRQSYVADVGAREILNAVGQGRTVEAHFEDTVEKSGDQIYEYLKFKDNSAYFRRFYLMPDKVTVRQIDIEIKLNKEVVFTDSKAEFATADEAQNLTHDKLDVKYERIDGKEVSQLEARTILENPTEYEDKFIIFMANSGSPTKAVATGFIVNDGEGNTYLSVTDNEGHYKRFNKDNFETFEIIAKDRTKETLALDDLTIDVQGQAGLINSVHNAFNRPENTSTDGIIKVVAYNIENQLQEYTDVKNGYKYVRLVTGTANQHSFGMWQRVDVTIENAKVGEAVFVKSVDSNNHPTEYETKTVGGDMRVSPETELTKQIQPNIFYKWGEVATLNITFVPETEGIVNDYHFSFKSGLAPTQLTLPETVKWVSQPNIEASKTYEVSIVNNLGVICGA